MSAKGKKPKGGARTKRRPDSLLRRLARRTSLVLAAVYLLLSAVGVWFVGHPRAWLEERERSWAAPLYAPLFWFGDRAALVLDGLGITGHDAVYEYDEPPPAGRVFFAGPPRRTGAPAPADVKILDKGEFVVGYSPSLGHAAWTAYHVPAASAYEAGERPGFRKDPDAPSCPAAGAYARTGYDRGHLAPNHAIATRFGPEVQRKTFYMTNVAPQRPSLNRGPWRFVERLLADVWTHRYGEIWVIAGTIPSVSSERLSGTAVDVPSACWQLLVAQTDEGVRALAVVLPQTVRYGEFPVHYLVTVDELEQMTGYDFLPELPGFIQSALEADRPTRLWPVNFLDVFRLILLRLT